jgi:CubicO group peptidase (beta-lactamase class C family)
MVSEEVPGLQYLVVDANGRRFEHIGGFAEYVTARPMTPGTTLMGYSMTKTLTAVLVHQLADAGALSLDDRLDRWLPDTPYAGAPITLRQLLSHTAGIPNPIPLRWVHPASASVPFDERAALRAVLADHPRLDAPPGRRFQYSNIGYWLLGPVLEAASGRSFGELLRTRIAAPLGLGPESLGLEITDPANHATGYLARHSWLNMLKGFVMDGAYFGGTEGPWLRIHSHRLNGPAFGGVVATARGFGRFLQDQLAPTSVLLSPAARTAMMTRQRDAAGEALPMTLGWHARDVDGETCLYKEGGGGGFHGEMRLYPRLGLGTVLLTNATMVDMTRWMTPVDRLFLDRA